MGEVWPYYLLIVDKKFENNVHKCMMLIFYYSMINILHLIHLLSERDNFTLVNIKSKLMLVG